MNCGRVRKSFSLITGLVTSTFLFALMPVALAEKSAEAAAKKLANPIAALISVPLQFNYDENIGAAEQGSRNILNIQPVVPISLNDDWNIISRTILPVVSQESIFAGSGKQSGIGDVVQSVFFSPKEPAENGWIWGVGPVFLLPTASNALLGSEKWATGPTVVALRQEGPVTYGILANHIWSFAGQSSRTDINSTFMQPFVSYTSAKATTFSLSSESTYNWRSNDWTVPINLQISQVIKFGNQLVSVGVGGRYWAKTTSASPKGFGARLLLTFLFPK